MTNNIYRRSRHATNFGENMNLFLDEKEHVISTQTFINAMRPYVQQGDTVSVEMDIMVFGKLYDSTIPKKDFLDGIFSIFSALVGPSGHIVLPSFSYSWGMDKKEKIFDIQNTPGKVGTFPEFFRKNINCSRTLDPMFSFLICGQRSEELASINKSSFGKGSVYEKMLNENAKLISFGLKQYDPTFVHYVEQYFDENMQKIDYRYLKKFEGTIIDKGVNYQSEHYSFMRYPGSEWFFSEKKLVQDLKKTDRLVSLKIGNASVDISSCADVFEAGINGMKSDMHYFVEKREK